MPASQHTNVCLASLFAGHALRRQTPKNDFVWKQTRVHLNNEEECSWLCVFGEPPAGWTTRIPRHRRIVVITEPKSIIHHPLTYLNQFGTVINPYRRLLFYRGRWLRTHPHITWFKYGLIPLKKRHLRPTPYPLWQDIKAEKKKTKRMSVICSGKRLNRFQAQRLRFVAALRQELGTQIDFYGRDDNRIEDKADALDPYRYHIALENNQDKHFWTEKLAESYLGEAYPIHAGCKNLHDYFPRQAYTSINIFNIPSAIQKVKEVIASNLYETNREHILEAKRRVIKSYQLFPVIDRLVHAHGHEPYRPLATPVPIKQSYGIPQRLRGTFDRDWLWRKMQKSLYASQKTPEP
ncbi:MAG: hypothetical protein GDA50_00895 [Alphaproteobacteria bacterium GM202ARS2]|nr:hypothetical protein [Alphaproteobacteria bacterium GM202ARS2]